jgi:light-regulated signal transduction histidine kinase (bacteriophytochrome)
MVMAIAEDMKKLTENIIISNDVRLKAVGGLVADTHETLNRFSIDRKKMATQQSKDLSDFVNGLSKDVQGMLKSARNMVQQFHKENMQISKEQAKNLADFVNGLVSSVGSMLDSFQKDHNHMSKEMKVKLTREIKDIQAEVERILGEADKLVGEFGAGMAQAKKAWENMSAALTRARKAGFMMPEIDAGEKVRTVKQATRKTKAQGKRKSAQKSKSNRQKTKVGV